MKKAQITIFIIFALVIVITVSFLIYKYSNKKIMDFSEQEDSNIKELSPVKVYVEEAMQKLLVEGLFLISKQGGKIYDNTWPDCKEEDNTYTRDNRMCLQKGLHPYSYPTYLSQSPYNHKRVAIGINSSRVDDAKKWTQSSKEPMQQPFAYPHIGKFLIDDYLYGLNQPLAPINYDAGEHSIEAQLSRWIENHLLEVIDFYEFKKMGFDITLPDEPPSVRVKINEDNIIANMEYNISIEKSHKKYLLNEYYTQIESNFRQLYLYVNTLINIDISSLADIKRVLPMYAIVDGQKKRVGGALVIESIPPNHKYDIVNVTTTLIDYTKEYGNVPDSYLRFYFIRENRAPDASTVYIDPDPTFAGNSITWYCPNYQTIGKWFDPDEDDEYSSDFTNPLWYQWYSRGDKLKTRYLGNPSEYEYPVDHKSVAGQPFKGCPIIQELKYRNEPSSTTEGPSWTGSLNACGNEKFEVSATTTPEDVGDIIILKVGDSQDFEIGDSVTAPERYPKSPVYETGFGKLNDVITFSPVKCEKGLPLCGLNYETCGDDGYWRFNDHSSPAREDEHCLKVCTRRKYIAPTQPSQSHPQGTSQDCVDADIGCSEYAVMKWHVDHTGNCVPFYDIKGAPIRIINDDCQGLVAGSPPGYCYDIEETLCDPTGWPAPGSESPETYSEIKPVSCANEDGYCQDQGIPVEQSECGDFENWVHLSGIDVIKKIEKCKLGTCYIRGKEQVHKQNYYSCAALCKETGECDCPSDLDSCTGDWDWKVLPEQE